MSTLKSKPSLIIVAHGSRREQSNLEVQSLAEQISLLDDTNFSHISSAFLELAEPSIPDALENNINSGSKTIFVFPYFLSAGRHVSIDVPNEVAKIQLKYPDIDIQIKNYLGNNIELPKLILKQLIK
ncbi:MAG: CbiX/SirB N-terminal domain-containing protein [Gammaproteobacteria bacterium]|nr:CbiX/SirB N-terminal domain-containing protein [Gammaproteobacteria bacterium]